VLLFIQNDTNLLYRFEKSVIFLIRKVKSIILQAIFIVL